MFTGVLAYLGMFCLCILSSTKYISAFGFLVPLALIAADLSDEKEPGFLARVLYRLSMIGLFPLLLLSGNYLITGAIFEKYYFAGKMVAAYYAAAIAVSIAICLVILRFGTPLLNKTKAGLTKTTELERNKKTDVREIHKILPPEIGGFDPVKLFPSLKENKLLVGLDERKKPVFIDYDSWKISHCLLTGRTRSGKGVAAQILLSQAIRAGEYVVILDPKVDNWMPYIFKSACEAGGKPYRFVDLRQSAGPQINPFSGCDEETIENMLVGGFSLTEKGEAADFYRLADRKAARRAATWLAQNDGATAGDCIAAIGEKWSEEAPAFLSYMQEMSELPSVCRPGGTGGVDIAEGVETGGLLYVVGDMINPRIIRMQRMILLRLLFLAKNRDQITQGRTITVFADEFKVHISRPFITSLGASAGWGLHTILAFQSLQDLADCPADLDKDSVRGSVMENCGIQLSYAIKDPETAEWLAASTGKILVDDEQRRVSKNLALAEKLDDERSIRQAERYLIDTNMLQNMPKGCGVLAVVGRLPAFCYTSPVVAERTPAAVTPTAPPLPPAAAAAAAGRGALDLDDDENPEPDYSDSESESVSESDSLSETESETSSKRYNFDSGD